MSLYLACRYGNVKQAEELITKGANVNWPNPLMVSKNCTLTAEVMHVVLLCLVHSYDLHDPWKLCLLTQDVCDHMIKCALCRMKHCVQLVYHCICSDGC